MRTTAIAVFAASVSAMFGTSALYHRGNWAAAWHRRLQRLDHAMTFLLIASTATAVFLIATHGAARVAGLVTIWALALGGSQPSREASGSASWVTARNPSGREEAGKFDHVRRRQWHPIVLLLLLPW